MNRYVLDSWAWLEYLNGTEKGVEVEAYLRKGEIFTNIVAVTEIVSKTQRMGKDANVALSAIGSLSRIVNLNVIFAKETGVLHAAMKKTRPNFSLGDAFTLNTAKNLRCKVLAGDPDFKGLKEAIMVTSSHP